MIHQNILRNPHDGSEPDPYLEGNIDNLGQVPKKHDYRTGSIADSQHKKGQPRRIVQNLKDIQIGKSSVAGV